MNNENQDNPNALSVPNADTNTPKLGQKASFTPAPWQVHKSDHAETGLLIEQVGGYVIAECDPLHNMADNARLIAAAPELFQAVKFACEEIDGILEDQITLLDDMTEDQLNEMLPVLRRALATVRGEAGNE